MSDMFSTLLKETDNEYACVADDGIEAGDITGYISTGSYPLNALMSGEIKLLKVGNESIGVMAGSLQILKMRFKFESEKL